MAEPAAFSAQRESESPTYQRLSALAVVGFALAILFSGFTGLQVLLGMASDAPVLNPWLVLLTAISAAVSLLGLLVVSRSEGTLAGMRLAQWGWWLSLVCGLGYGAYYWATYMAITQQANEFVMEWFEKLRQGKVNQAFLFTHPQAIRSDVNPDDARVMEIRFNSASNPGPDGKRQRGQIDYFRGLDTVRKVIQAGENAEVQPKGVTRWEYKAPSYVVARTYQVTTPEGKFDISVTADGREGREQGVEGRSWTIWANELGYIGMPDLNDRGKRVPILRRSAKDFLEGWLKKLRNREPQKAFLETIDLKDRDEVAKKKPMPGYEEAFVKGGIFDFKPFRTDDEGIRTAVKEGLQNLLIHSSKGYQPVAVWDFVESTERSYAVDKDNRLLLPLDMFITIAAPTGTPKYLIEAVAIIQSPPGLLDSGRDFNWRLAKILIVKATDVNSAPSEYVNPDNWQFTK